MAESLIYLPDKRPSWLEESVVLYTMSGSRAYGTNVEGSDEDFKGVYLAPYSVRSGFQEQAETIRVLEPDVTVHELRAFFLSAAKCNPNILEILFIEEAKVLKCTPIGAKLRSIREQFLSQKVFYSYAGYAESQLKRLEGYRNNSETRRELREEFGYDTKFGMHLIRLLRMLNEIVSDGKVLVTRPDAEDLISIRRGSMTLTEIQAEAEALKSQAYNSLKTSALPIAPNYKLLNEHCIAMYRELDGNYSNEY